MSGTVGWYYAVNGTQVGPFDAETMRRKRIAGEIADDTYCWEPGFGADWRSFRDTELAAHQAATPYAVAPGTPAYAAPGPMPYAAAAPGQPAAPVNNTYAWLFAFVPIPGYLASLLLQGSNAASTVVSLGLYAGLYAADKREILKSGYTNVPNFGWILIAPVYLWRRATLLAQSRAPFWVMIAMILLVAGVAIGTNRDLLAQLPGGNGLLSCSGAQADALRIFNTIDAVKKAGVEGVSITDVSETSVTDAMRSCHGTVNGRDAKQYAVDFEITKQGDNNYIKVMIK